MQKFLFETAFDDSDRDREEAEPEPMFDAEALEAARQAAHTEGVAAGEAAALQSITAATRAAVTALDGQIEALREQLSYVADQARRDGISIAMAAVRAMFPRLAAAYGMQEIEAMVGECLELARHEPAIVFKFHPVTLEVAGGPLEEMAAARAYAGKLVLLADAKIAPDGCAAEWADGGADRDSEAVLKRIDELVAEALGAEPTLATGEPTPGETDIAADADTGLRPETGQQES